RHRDGMDLHFGRDDFASQGKLINTLSRDRAKDMASDYDQQIDPAQDYAERRGISFRARVAQIMRRLMPERVREALDGFIDSLRAPGEPALAPGPEREVARQEVRRDVEKVAQETGIEPEELLHRMRREQAFIRHARVVDAIFKVQDQGRTETPEQVQDLHEARTAFNELRPDGARDAEAVYKRNPEFATEAASGDPDRTAPVKRAIRMETEMRRNPDMRADRFVERFRELRQTGEREYAAGNYSGYRSARAEMGNMAMSLERDPQMESLLEGRKKQLGIGMDFDSGMRLGRQLALSHGLGRGRGIGL
ncbi:Ti-type conjugative transfer relaxase TraA, partial [Rhodobacteraceae bacterium PA1-206B]